MASLSTYLANKLLDHANGVAEFTMPPTVYVALYTTDPTKDDVGTEVTGGAYARQAITFNAASAGLSSNPADILFPIATADWGTVGWLGVRDASTAGNLLWHQALGTAYVKDVAANDQFKIAAGKLSTSLS